MATDLGIYWLKKDFRLEDNPALTLALANHQKVALIYVIEDQFLESPETSAFHAHAVFGALQSLQDKLKKDYRRKINIFTGNVIKVLESIYAQTPFQKLYSHEEIGIDWTYQRDLAVAAWCNEKEIEWKEPRQTGVFRRLTSRDERRKLWNKFTFAPLQRTPSHNKLKKLTNPRKWKCIDSLYEKELSFADFGFELSNPELVQSVNEEAAHQTLEDFLYYRGIAYRGGISSPLKAFTAGSRLSVHLAWGTISGRYVYQKTKERKDELKKEIENTKDADLLKELRRWRSSLSAFSSRLHWRDHFIQRLESEPQMEFEALNPVYKELEYDDEPEFLEAWQTGYTGFPMVDACIRCLRQTGFMNFRMRAMLASVACHTLHLSWKTINAPMARLYTDYEPGIHLSQLQMQAGVVGINTLRVYSPTKQIIDQDPECIFIKEWIPELCGYSAQEIIDHPESPLKGYPAPLVDWKESSRRMKDKVYGLRRSPEAKEISKKVYEKHGSRKGSMKSRRNSNTRKKKKSPSPNQIELPYNG